MKDANNEQDIISEVKILNPRKLFSLFIPLGENSIIQLVDKFRSRADLAILKTDLYYFVEISFKEFIIRFYSKGLVTFEKKSENENDFLENILSKIELLAESIANYLELLLNEYQRSILSVLGELGSIPVHKTIIFESLVLSDFNVKNISDRDRDMDLGQQSDSELSLNYLKLIASNKKVLDFIGDLRSIDHRPYEDVIIGTKGSFVRSLEIDLILPFHSYNRTLHLFLTKYNFEIEKQWLLLDKCDSLLDQTEKRLTEEKLFLLGDNLAFSPEQRKLLSKTKSQVINAIKETDYFVVLTQYLTNSIDETSQAYALANVKPNSFHIRKLLKTLQGRVNDLEFVSESFITRGRTLVTRIDLIDNMISFEIQQQENFFKDISKSWRRTYTYGIPQSKVDIKASDIIVHDTKVIYSFYMPLGENSIIQLVDDFSTRPDLTILDSDLYYYVKVSFSGFIFSFFSRGLVNAELKLPMDQSIKSLVEEILVIIQSVPKLIKELLSAYQLSLIEVIGDIESIPIHKTIIMDSLDPIFDSILLSSSSAKEHALNGLANDPIVLQFIGNPRSIDASKNSNVIIGTEGSLINSDQIELLQSYHCYNRSLHLFLQEYNKAVEKAWTTLKSSEELVSTFEQFMNSGEKRKKHKDLFSGNKRKDLASTKLIVNQSIRNLNNFEVLTQFIEDSIQFTIAKYTDILEQGKVKENPFENRKVLKTLKDRTKHLLVVSESFSAKSDSLFARLDIYDSEISYETQQKIERSAFIIGLLGTILAILAIIVDLKI